MFYPNIKKQNIILKDINYLDPVTDCLYRVFGHHALLLFFLDLHVVILWMVDGFRRHFVFGTTSPDVSNVFFLAYYLTTLETNRHYH